MRTFPSLLVGGLAVFFITNSALRADDKVIVHEWGTFTSLQDETGGAIGGINVDDEPVPGFVFGWGGVRPTVGKTVFPADTFGLPPYYSGKGWMPGDQDVTMRLETPVIYIYPPKGQTPQTVPPLNVHVDFHGGILSQYYPYAVMSGLPGNPPDAPSTTIVKDMRMGDVTSHLFWKGVRLGSTATPVVTDDKVWITPREVSAPVLEAKKPVLYDDYGAVIREEAEAEHFLFYRGIGHLDSPISIGRAQLDVGSALCFSSPSNQTGITGFDAGWLVEIHVDGSCAIRLIGSDASLIHTGGMNIFKKMASFFVQSDFTADNLAKLKASMQDALVKEGLYPDEASAMLRTWELSYFKSPGRRFFYIVPREWVDKVLPLKITGAPTYITRVMIGRIELITDAQKAALARLATGPCPDLAAIKKEAFDALNKSTLSDQEKRAFYDGEKPLSELGITIPSLVQDYLSLGRFRDALIVHEQQQHPSAALAQFIKDNQLASEEN